MENTKLTREQLYELVWTEPLSRLAKQYCISDNGIRKMCKTLKIPLPPNGYWMKIKYGKKVKKTQLPKQDSGKQEVVLRARTENCNEQSKVLSDLNLLTNEIMNDQNLVLEVPDRLSSRPDPFITSTKNYRDALKKYDWRRNDRYPDRIDVLNIDVTEDRFPRAYRLMDAIIKLLRSRNHGVKISGWDSFAVIQGEEIKFRLREKNKVASETTSYGGRIMKPTGDFVFAIGKYSWREKYVADGKQRLETKLAVILAKLELEGKTEHEERIMRESQWKIQEEQERIARELKERKEVELKRFTNLFKEALMLEHARILRQYIEKKHGEDGHGYEWLEWALEKVDWYNPLKDVSDELLNEEHKSQAFNYFMNLK